MKIIQNDFLSHDFKTDWFDVITAISVLEHVDHGGDTLMLKKGYSLLKPGGRMIITLPFNENYPRDFYLSMGAYSQTRSDTGRFFYQRHYDKHALQDRILCRTQFQLEMQLFFGEPGYRLAEFLYCGPVWRKWIKAFYLWASPWIGRYLLEILKEPPSVKGLGNFTVNGCFLILRK